MKTVLVASDFSHASDNAILYAVEFAKAFEARLVVYHAFRIIHNSDILLPPLQLKENAKNELEKHVRELSIQSNVDIEIEVDDAVNISDSIIKMANEKEASMIFLGVKSRGLVTRKIFGSTAARLSHQTDLPLIVVPEKAEIAIPKAVMLANDIHIGMDISILLPLKEFVKRLSCKFYIARITRTDKDNAVEESLSTRLSFYLADIQPQLLNIQDKNVNRGLSELLTQHKLDLIVMIPHRHSITEKILEGSKTDYMVLHAKIPVMVLPHRDPIELKLEQAKSAFVVNQFAIE